MAAIPRTPLTYSCGVLAYVFFGGVAYAAFSAVVLFAIGRGAASTKYATLSSLGNLPVVYMTAADGWATPLVWHQLDARVDALQLSQHRDCTFRFAGNFGPTRDYSALIKQSSIAFLHGR
jgi:hypothetical protein